MTFFDRNSRTSSATCYAVWPRAETLKVRLTRRDKSIQASGTPPSGGRHMTHPDAEVNRAAGSSVRRLAVGQFGSSLVGRYAETRGSCASPPR